MIQYLATRYQWQVDPDWLVWTPGVVSSLHAICAGFGASDTKLVTAVPIYPPFLAVPKHCGKELICLSMKKAGNRFTMDLDEVEQVFARENVSVFMLCSPHNPCGTIFTREELERLVQLCIHHGVVLCSDEIHSDFILDQEVSHIPAGALSPGAAEQSITLMAPSKTFNIPGLGCSFAVVPNPERKKVFTHAMAGIVPDVNIMGLAGAQAAYSQCQDWLDQLLVYLKKNRDLTVQRVNAMKGAVMYPGAATYLAWIDLRATGLTDPVGFLESSGIGLSDGRFFGAPGYVRLNFGCPRHILEKGLGRMERALLSMEQAMLP